MGIELIANIINQRETPAFNSNKIANRPAAGYVGRIFISTDTFVIQRDNGTGWDNIGGVTSGSGAAGQVTFWTGAATQSGDNGLFWDNVNKRLGLGTITPGALIDAHGTGVIMQLNGTGISNAFLAFQSAGVTQWRIGNTASPSNFTINDTNGNQVFNLTQSGIFSFKFPTGALMSIDSVAGGDGISINPVSTNSGFLSFKSGTFRVGINSTNQFVVRTAGTDLLSVTSTGQLNVGGNFTSTNNTLQVAGNAAIGYTIAAPTNGLIVNGNVGLGTSSPVVRLDVHGTGVIQQLNGTGTTNSYLDFQNAGSTQWRIGNSYLAGTNRLDFFNANTLNVFTILQNGSIGIGLGAGTPSNSYAISTNGDSTTNTGGIAIRRSGTDVMYMGNISGTNTVDFEFFNPRNGFIRWATNNIVGMTLSNNQFLGIGYSNPNIALAVSGSIYQGTNTANALYEMFCNGNLYTGGFSPTILTVGINTTMTRTVSGYRCTATLTLTLPSASGLNNIYYVIANTGATVTVQRAGSDTIVDKTGASVTSVTVAAGTRSMFYVGGGTETFQIF